MDGGFSKDPNGAAAADEPNPERRNPSADNLPPPPPATAATASEGRRPFTSLSQEEADLALARVLQEQERAYMMLTTGQGGGDDGLNAVLDLDAAGDDGYEYDDDDDDDDDEEEEQGEEDVSDYEEEGDAVDDDLDLDLDPARYDVAGRLLALAGFGMDWRTMEEQEEEEQDADPDEYTYEELLALGEVVGTESKGLSADTIASLPSVTYQAQDKQQDGNMEQCVVCRVEFEEGESLVALPCKHSYHSECINHWLQLNKVCPMCSAEVPTSL